MRRVGVHSRTNSLSTDRRTTPLVEWPRSADTLFTMHCTVMFAKERTIAPDSPGRAL